MERCRSHRKPFRVLRLDTPFAIPGVPGSVINADGSTTFYDVTLHMGGMTPIAGAADVTLLGNAVQILNSGTFSNFWDTDGTRWCCQGTITNPNHLGPK